MKKPLWMKFIIFVVVFMVTISSILPTKVVRAEPTSPEDEASDQYLSDYQTKDVSESGWYAPCYSEGGDFIGVITNFTGKENNIFYFDENGEKVVPQIRENGDIYLESGKKYYYIKTFNSVPVALHEQGSVSYELARSSESMDSSEQKDKDDASLVESIITRMLLILGAGVYAIVCLVIGEQFSIEKVLFNDYTNTQLDFFTGAKANTFMRNANIKTYLTDFYNFFSKLAFVTYLIILVYMGIRIMLGATAEKGARYKELVKYWLEGIIILFIFPAVMKYSIEMNNAFVSFLGENKVVYMQKFEESMPKAEEESGTLADVKDLINNIIDKFMGSTDYMAKMFKLGWNNGWLVYAICWYVMFIQMIGFLVVYFRRVLIIMFLIAIFPLVMVSYAIDKIRRCKITSI